MTFELNLIISRYMSFTMNFWHKAAFVFLLVAPTGAHAANTLAINSKVVITRTLNDSLAAKSLELEDDIAKQDVQNAKAQYDLNLGAGYTYNKDESERASTVFGTDTSAHDFNVGLSQLIPLGTEFTASFDNTRNATNSIFATSPSLYESSVTVGLTQPLLKNSFGTITRGTVSVAKKTFDAEKLQNKADLNQLVYENLITYWQWYLQWRLKDLSENALSAAARLYRINTQKVAIGLIDKSDIHAFLANVDLKRSDLFLAGAALKDHEAVLKPAINITDGNLTPAPLSHHNLESKTNLIGKVLVSNKGYKALQAKLKALDAAVVVTKNAKLPQVDLVASLTLNGIDPAYGTAVSDVGDGHTNVTGGVQFALPLQNRAAKSAYKKSKLQTKQLLTQLKDLENQIVSQVSEGYERCQINAQRVGALKSAVENQRLKWDGEIIKYDQGRSEPDTVIRYQNDYLDTQKLLVQSEVAYEHCKMTLEYVAGELIADHPSP